MSTRRTSRRMAYRFRRNSAFSPLFLQAVEQYLNDNFDTGEPSDSVINAVATYLSSEVGRSVESAQSGDDILDQIMVLVDGEEEDYLEFALNVQQILDKEERPSSQRKIVQPLEESEEEEEEEESTPEISVSGGGDLASIADLLGGSTPKAEEKKQESAPQTSSIDPNTARSMFKKTKPKAKPSGGESQTRTSDQRAQAGSFAEDMAMKDKYEMTPYDKLRLLRFEARSKRVQKELGLFFFFLELRKRTLPLPTVDAFNQAMKADPNKVLPKGFPTDDYRSPEYRENAFVVYRSENGNAQLFLPSVNPLTIESTKRIPKKKRLPLFWSPSLEFISRPDLSSYREAPFPSAVTDVLKAAGVPSTQYQGRPIGFPNPANPQSVASWYQMLHGYIGTQTVETPFRQKNKSGKFAAYNVLVFVMTGKSLELVNYFPSPRQSYRQFLPPKYGSMKQNPKKRIAKKRKKVATKRRVRKIAVVRKKR